MEQDTDTTDASTDWGLKTAGVSSYIEPSNDGAAQTNRQWHYASNIDEYNCQADNCLSVELFNNVTACKLRELHASSCNCMKACVTAIKLRELHASSGNCMQAHVTACKLM